MNKNISTLSFIIIMSIVTTLALTVGDVVNMPDNVHTNYGFPFDWGIHTTSTIVGAVDLWSVDVTNLMIDLTFWLGLTVIITAIILYSSKR